MVQLLFHILLTFTPTGSIDLWQGKKKGLKLKNKTEVIDEHVILIKMRNDCSLTGLQIHLPSPRNRLQPHSELGQIYEDSSDW